QLSVILNLAHRTHQSLVTHALCRQTVTQRTTVEIHTQGRLVPCRPPQRQAPVTIPQHQFRTSLTRRVLVSHAGQSDLRRICQNSNVHRKNSSSIEPSSNR